VEKGETAKARMKFSELVRLLERNGFTLVREKGSIRYYGKPGLNRLRRVDYHGCERSPYWYMQCHPQSCWVKGEGVSHGMIDLPYSLVMEATADPSFFGFHSPDLEGFTGVGHSIEDCLYKARLGMEEHISLLREQGCSIPDPNPDPTVVIHNERRIDAVA
jgi:predicted RNA binding protein YcfA (HicA-like mRNA interferase family)/predicted RNase H-like HicB family nuclease